MALVLEKKATAELDESARCRSLTGPIAWLADSILIAIPALGIFFLLDVPQRLGWMVFPEQYIGLFLGLALCAAFLTVPEGAEGTRGRVPWYDLIAAALGFIIGLYVFIQYPKLVYSLGEISPDRVILGCLTMFLLAEACRRLVGWPLIIIVGAFLFYALFANYFPGAFYGRGWSLPRLSTYLFLDTNGMLGQALQVAAGIVLVFVLFGQTLYAVGGAAFLSDFALAVTGRFRGGPAKMAIVSSSLFGTISGSAVANVVVDGAFTIPMMKKSGYSPPVAAAVEATASTGGQIMPPVMGAAAFLMAEYLGIPYAEVALAAFVPALLFYVALFVQVDLLAGRQGLRGLPPRELPSLGSAMRRSASFLVPLSVLVTFLFIIPRRAEVAGSFAIISALIAGFFTPGVRLRPKTLIELLHNTGRGLLDIAAITGLAGIVIGVLQLTGLGFTLTLTKLGIVAIAAHLFIFYFGMLSMITPPVCLAIYAAASLAKTDPIRAGWEAVRLGVLAYIVPFLFVFSPTLLLLGPWGNVALSVVTAVFGTGLLGVGLVGYLFRVIGPLQRVLFIAAAVGLLIPIVDAGRHATLTWASNGVGLILGAALILIEWLARPRGAARLAIAAENLQAPAGNPRQGKR
ncbi:MAG: TRAP transporter fused permease subunit [Deltaproteobacteria bacterium]|nr:TRAP transporter fused permease subunit [Deltaproteobacteria bacterium]